MNQWQEFPSYRLLVTGSRMWTDVNLVNQTLWVAAAWLRRGFTQGSPNYRPITLVHGAAVGADLIAAAAAVSFGWVLEPYPYNEVQHRGDPRNRNTEMVMAGADLCVAFYIPPVTVRKGGTRDCFEKAMERGITTWVVRP